MYIETNISTNEILHECKTSLFNHYYGFYINKLDIGFHWLNIMKEVVLINAFNLQYN